MDPFWGAFPPREQIASMDPEELGPFILRYLKGDASGLNGGRLNRYNFGNSLPGDHIGEALMEAWMWLEREGFLAPKPGDAGEWRFITRKGQAIEAAEDFAAYNRASMFPVDVDPVLVRLVKPLFLRGDYDTAVFRAFKEVEVRVRSKADLGLEHFGRGLMQRAFGTPALLTGSHPEDTAALRELFSGAMSFFKNPSSHREVQFEDPQEVIDMICSANHLLRIVGRLKVVARS